MTQRWIETVIGRLLTDDAFRETFVRDPRIALDELIERGTDLTPIEVTALLAIDPALWNHVATQIDPRLRKAILTNP